VGRPAETPHAVRRVVSNTGPLLHLYEAQELAILAHTGEVSIPPAVELELLQHDPVWRHHRPPWVQIARLTEPHAQAATTWQQAGLLGAGEAEAIALAQQVQADWLLTDDAAARLFAQALGIEVHGSLGIVLWAAAVGHLNREVAGAALDRLAQSSLWVSARVLAEAKAALLRLSQ
jgi:predicted nucleic acid-binding protein